MLACACVCEGVGVSACPEATNPGRTVAVSGLGGMNVKIPFQDVDSLWPFFAITAFMLAICACMFCYFRRRNLL